MMVPNLGETKGEEHPSFWKIRRLLHPYQTRDLCFFGVTHDPKFFRIMAGTTGLEPATSAVTGQRSNQLSYVPQYRNVFPTLSRSFRVA